MSRVIRIIALACALSCVTAIAAQAARIDPELKRLLFDNDKSRVEIIPVLMVFPDQPELDDLEVMLDGATPSKRRKSTIAALKRQARKAQGEVWEFLEGPGLPGELAYADMLYFSNSIAFGADREVILAVSELGDDKALESAILFYDKPLELLNTVRPPSGGTKSARADTAWNVQYLQADRVWKELGYDGEGILIGHIDTGVDYEHADLKRRIHVNPAEIRGNGIDDDANGLVDDISGWDFGDGDADPRDDSVHAGHGTHTAGSAVGDGAGGMQTGVAPGASILPVKIFDSAGGSTLGRIWAAQQYCAESGARIITMSLGLKGEIPAEYLRNDRFNADGLRAAGVVLFNSAGNYHAEYNPPIEIGMTARIPAPWSADDVPSTSTGGVITVGGSAYRTDESFPEGSQGPVTWDQVGPWYDWPYVPGPGLIKPDVTAPAMGIPSTLPDGYYSGDTWTGTSMACPQVAGVAALMLQKNPTLSPAGIDSLLELTARDAGAAGKDPVFGAGVVDAFAAVQAVPLDLLPNISAATFRPDPHGDHSLDPAEEVTVVFDLDNAGVAAATAVTGRLSIDRNPHISVIRDVAMFPDAAPGAVVHNEAMPFVVAVSPAAPHGATFTMHLTVGTAEGFERTFDLKADIGLPLHRTHDNGRVFLTATAGGSLGYVSDQQLYGHGMGLSGGTSALFAGSLWAGTGAPYVCANDLTADGADLVEWTPRRDPVGNVRIVADDANGQVFSMAFTDSNALQPRGVEVELVSRTTTEEARASAVVLEYTISNRGGTWLNNYHAGLFMDWDVIDALGNVGRVDQETRSVMVGMPGGPVFGMAVLGDAPVGNLTVVDNPTYVYPFIHVIDTHKFQLLNGTLGQDVADQPTDLSALVSAGPFVLGPGEMVRVRFALVYGVDEQDFLVNVRALAGEDATTAVDDDRPQTPAAPSLAQNHPNPFNPATTIAFSVPRAGRVSLAVYDMAGRVVRTLVDGDLSAGPHAVTWRGRTDQGAVASSGLYFYKLRTADTTITRKMTLLK
jgi:subtilisin family serine protease